MTWQPEGSASKAKTFGSKPRYHSSSSSYITDSDIFGDSKSTTADTRDQDGDEEDEDFDKVIINLKPKPTKKPTIARMRISNSFAGKSEGKSKTKASRSKKTGILT